MGLLRESTVGQALRSLTDPRRQVLKAFGLLGNEASSGMTVTEENSMQLMAVYSAVRILSETLASLPLKVFRRRSGGGKEEARDHPLWSVLHRKPNEELDTFQYREMKMANHLLWGNTYSQIIFDGGGRVSSLWPLPSKFTDPERNEDSNLVFDDDIPGNRSPTGEAIDRTIPFSNVLFIPGLSFNGIRGISPIRHARNAIGMGLAAEEFGARFFANDATPGGVLEHPGVLSEKAESNIKRSWNREHGGPGRSGGIEVLEEGMTYNRVGMPPGDAQFLETRKFQVTEIARMFRIPPHLLADLERATFSNIEQQSLEFVIHTVRPWLTRWESAINTQLISPRQQGEIFVEFAVEGLLRGDSEARAPFYESGIQNGWLTPNDVRQKENLNPIPGGDKAFIMSNLANLETEQPLSRETLQGMAERENGGEPEPEHRYYYAGALRSSAWRAQLMETRQSDVVEVLEDLIEEEIRQLHDDPASLPEVDPDPVHTTLRTLGQSLATMAAEEIGGDVPATRIESFVDEWIEYWDQRHAQRLQVTEEKVYGAEAEEGQREQFLEEYRRQGTREARRAIRRLGNAAARRVFTLNGVNRFAWQQHHDNPVCRALAQRTANLEEPFGRQGETVDTEDGSTVLDTDLRHPPAGDGCSCLIIPRDGGNGTGPA